MLPGCTAYLISTPLNSRAALSSPAHFLCCPLLPLFCPAHAGRTAKACPPVVVLPGHLNAANSELVCKKVTQFIQRWVVGGRGGGRADGRACGA